MQINPRHAANARKTAKRNGKKRKMRNMWTISARKNGESGKSGSVALGDMDIRDLWFERRSNRGVSPFFEEIS